MSRKSLFTREEKIAAVSLVIDKGRSTLSVANEYEVHDNTIIKWRNPWLTELCRV
jgi:transposase-like protein